MLEQVLVKVRAQQQQQVQVQVLPPPSLRPFFHAPQNIFECLKIFNVENINILPFMENYI